MVGEKISQEVIRAFKRISVLIEDDKQVTKREVIRAICDLKIGEFPALFVKLDELKKKAEDEYHSEVSNITDSARADAMFNSGVSTGMEEFYDNEVRAETRGLRNRMLAINLVEQHLRKIKAKRKDKQ